MLRTLLLLSSGLVSVGIAVALGPMWLVVCFALCLLSLLLSTEGVAASRHAAPLRPVGAEPMH